MPWKEVLVSEARARFVFACREKRESFASLCRWFGISRKSGYKWLRRYCAGGVRALGDASRRPHYCAKAHRSFWRGRLRRARKARPPWGPKKLRRLLLARHCNEVWSVDFKGWFRTGDGRRCEPLTVRDVHSRFVLAVILLPNQSEAAVRQALLPIFRRYGLPKALRTDNGAPCGGKGALGMSRLSVWWLRLGIAVEFT